MSTGTSVSGYGITANLPAGWEGRFTVRAAVAPAPAVGAALSAAARTVGTTEVTRPYLHLANFALPPQRGNFGSGAVEVMTATDALVALIEFSEQSLSTALFRPPAMPRVLYPREFNRRGLQRILPGQAGYQAFFTESGRPFCLYVVLGGHDQATSTVPKVNDVLAGIQIDRD